MNLGQPSRSPYRELANDAMANPIAALTVIGGNVTLKL
jgi:hypothetical protein